MESEDNLYTVAESGEGEVENDDGETKKYQYKIPKAWSYDTMFNFETDEIKDFFLNQNFDGIKPTEAMQKFEPGGKFFTS